MDLRVVRVSKQLKVHRVYKVNLFRVFRVRLLLKGIKVFKVYRIKVFRAV